ncbi:hypothetical protein GPALN_012407 [Globodera pallida]|nr:hypothetical protein GPALN_012407 [Globodera pallida]
MKFGLITNIFALFVCGALAGCLPFNRKLKKASSVPAMSTNSSFSAQFSVNGVPMDAKKYMHELSTFRHESAGMDSLWQQQDRQKQYRTKLAHFLAAPASETLDAFNKANPQHTFGRSSSVVKDASASSSNSYKSCKSSFNSSYKSCNSTINKSKSLNSSTSRSFSNASNNSNNSWASSRNASTSGYNNNPSNSFNTQSFTNYSKSLSFWFDQSMNLPTIGIIFALFFCSAWAGPPSWLRLKIAPTSNTPSPQINASDPGSKSFSTRIMEDGNFSALSKMAPSSSSSSSSSNTPSPQWFKASNSNTPSPQWFKASDPGSKSFTESQIEDAIEYCHLTNFDPHRPKDPNTNKPVADPTKFFLSGGGRKKGQLKGRKKIDGRPPSLPENNFLSGSAGGDTNKPNGNNTKEERGKSQHREA